ncbi:hypothetical protein Y900_031105 [Mycolicibacterium aromaticivorans JS19b1 = JCM 16368]|uniref:Uncharacterized protein n=1 Tax=Mycolicibacterium aromaticivorans JS19b1 = JCM 16368 TaxID=1440774 RepID=A0A064CD66_9MYCO|nr:hypothetical protein [Mycolicibacterium aromaticivorans]KDE96668.1 hypothetical protein Y900_031105 [Mycolicibacterium aromaticivorans JS19b1 = JCM 16368]
MSLDAVFEDAARAHFANPPATWRIHPGPGGWNIVDLHGAVLDTCATFAQGEQCRHSGPAAQRWHRRTDWYLGYDDTSGSRPLTALERLIVADLVDAVTSADFEIRRATSVRPARFVDQEASDDRLWLAALLPDGHYRVRGDFATTYRADQLDFQDEQASAEFRTFLYELITGQELATAASHSTENKARAALDSC